MVTTLYVRDFALIAELTVSFAPGLTIITGETGAGKSILIGALSLVLGERASVDLVRSGANKAIIEAVLKNLPLQKISPILIGAAIDISDEMILRREISASGQSRCYINDTPCTVTLLKQIGELLIDLHGQHEHQLLLRTDTHEAMLDSYAQTGSEVSAYKETLKRVATLKKQLTLLQKKAVETKENKDLLTYQLNEINALELKAGEPEAIDKEIILLENAETLFSLCSGLCTELYDKDQSAYSAITTSVHILEKLALIDPQFESHLEENRTAASIIEELYHFSRRYTTQVEFNQEKLDELRQRQMQLHRAQKKYGKTLDELIVFREELLARLAMEETIDDEISLILEEIALEKTTLSIRAQTLSSKRQASAQKLERIIRKELGELGIPNAFFKISIIHEEHPDGEITLAGKNFIACSGGYDRIEFLVSANPGEKPKPLVKVASGGEISRIMLALKSALAASTDLPVLVFDEIDTGISGSVAAAVARSLKRLSKLHQIIAITHLPQIAAMADLHLSASKSVQQERTVTEVTALHGDARLHALASLVSGKQLSPSSLKLAGELLEGAKSV
ncbi:DNA repair protein RecN [Chlorobium phaeobacteroides]|uniref:DNA repair protein RecN n=1 Tax=Chlorobium phaeobacteroides (strain DSM 266 / SMG 266 / 2430) TaxID=290317 RepID=A1BE05_CHLPD|nr:DNA repair protein RecN [Chlorobium phaeobacteroides]ABL64632.1 DNA replication and repair protein RecN [Chlorobium phaeobacteroides DSM 266]